jgi:hypothetical protein
MESDKNLYIINNAYIYRQIGFFFHKYNNNFVTANTHINLLYTNRHKGKNFLT